MGGGGLHALKCAACHPGVVCGSLVSFHASPAPALLMCSALTEHLEPLYVENLKAAMQRLREGQDVLL